MSSLHTLARSIVLRERRCRQLDFVPVDANAGTRDEVSHVQLCDLVEATGSDSVETLRDMAVDGESSRVQEGRIEERCILDFKAAGKTIERVDDSLMIVNQRGGYDRQ